MPAQQTKYIFVTGGVCSGLGKGLSAAAIGAILKAAGFSVFTLKIDPYLNVDPGTMSPYQHGEVFVTEDGYEADLDLGHYERFIDVNLTRQSNLTTGQIYQRLIDAERKGKFLGKTIQIIPHITEEVKRYFRHVAKVSGADFLLIEVGGTVGDIEGEPYLEAARQFALEEGSKNALFVHITLLPYLKTSQELKTKPTQASVRDLRRQGIQPHIIIARSDYPIPKEQIEKISLFSNVKPEAVIPAVTASTIYEVPILFERCKISRTICDYLGVRPRTADLKEWKNLVRRMKGDSQRKITIAMVGKYTAHGDAYLSVNEALRAAAAHHRAKLKIEHIDSEELEQKNRRMWSRLKKVDGIVIPGGFGNRGVEGKILAAQYAREHNVPYFGLCLGMQIAVIEFARHAAGITGATSEEFSPSAEHCVIHIMEEQKKKMKQKDYGASMRLGAYPARLAEGSLARRAYKEGVISERHRHRYEFNNAYRGTLSQCGMRIAGTSPDNTLVEIVEIENHPWMVGVQFHPEFTSRPLRPHPLFRDFLAAALRFGKSKG